eukprot:TRINITY_DN96403_c0_g1_i2.p1 TRINITY_DN96403_c0_g1~~TRINITY_DN96403_c0_g1_i2.p1  ORF type:complete len:459 (-),score=82.63 TRINITY_DN96403_c0_g1_i2:45-1421(-)
MLQNIQRWNLEMGPFSQDVRLVAIDVVGLYTNIPHADLQTAVHFYLTQEPLSKGPPTDQLIEVMNHVLTNNVFELDGKFYQQKFGTAMGTPMAPTVACLFMGWLEKQMLDSSPVPVSETLWKRFIDDVFLLWMGSDDELKMFFDHINSFHPTIKFTMNSSTEKLAFLDILVYFKDGFLQTDLHTKATDSHGYLHGSSCHPHHVCRNTPYSQFLRLRRLCSDNEVFQQRCDEMEAHFRHRAYRKDDITRARERVRHTPRQETLTYKDKIKSKRVPFVVQYNPSNPPLRTWFKELQDGVLNHNSRMKAAMPEPPLLAERNCRSLRDILMPSTLPPSLDSNTGCRKCSLGRCVVCQQHLVETNSFRSDSTGESFTIRNGLNCETSNLIYLLYCDACTHAQYIGETENTLKDRFYKHRSHIKKQHWILHTCQTTLQSTRTYSAKHEMHRNREGTRHIQRGEN